MSLDKEPWAFSHASPEPTPDDLHDVCLNDEATGFETRIPLPAGSRPECLKNAAHECLFVALIAFAAATPVFLQRSTVVVVASIGESLDMTPAQMAWSTASSGLTTGAFLLPLGHVADTCRLLPRKALLITSLIIFGMLVACTSFSTNGTVLDIISGLTGLACAANIPIAVGILSLVYPVSSRRKNLVFSSFLMGTPAATIIGGLGSGALELQLSWKAPFVALGALYAIVSALAWAFVPKVSEPEDSYEKPELELLTEPHSPLIILDLKRPSELLHFDWLGLILLIAGILLLTVSLTIGPEGPEPWKTPTVIFLLILGALSLGLFILWETVTKSPMIPPSIWDNWNVTLVVLCTLSVSMSYYSQLFWVSMFMQEIEGLSPFDVAVRLLPQALVGLLFSPLVGLIMHRVSGTFLITVAAFATVLSNVLLMFLQHGNYHLIWILPSLMLSTVGLDWTMNVGSLYILSSLPLKHHSIGASLLQITSRLAVPLGMAITTAVWSSYDGKGDRGQPELAYTNVFITTTAFSGLALLLVPFLRIGKQGGTKSETKNQVPDIENSQTNDAEQMDFLPPLPESFLERELELEKRRSKDNRPSMASKRWSPVGTLTPTLTGGSVSGRLPSTPTTGGSVSGRRPSTLAPSVSSLSSSQKSAELPKSVSSLSSSQKSAEPPKSEIRVRSETTARTTIKQGHTPSEKIVWVVCEECGTSKRHAETTHASKRHVETTHAVVGDPARYFNDPACGGGSTVIKEQPHRHHQPVGPSLTQPEHQPAPQRPFGGRRRLPMVNRQLMTHQMLTQGFQL
ncbi:Uu.00g100260.m01.CDS01 [Anthostomella pinea]|uniref:Uu.00g100260.m01.CDS01 n=1 Tax=Anthostomella pinea TaxID=933095 RepID=A0AAI8VDZ0_9PEZI|nr:Uu.00g100260.m01.CDS01 [Anthostomella pinea]